MPISINDIYTGNGVSELISLCMQALLDNGDEILIPAPDYPLWTATATLAGGKVVHYICDEQSDWYPDIEDIRSKITDRTKAIVIINPNNPTGYLYSKEELEQLAVIVKKHDLYLYADEVYREFCYDGYKHFSTMQLAGIEQNVILLDSVSKRYSECGLRVGALVTLNKDVMVAALKFGMARLCAPAIGQIIAEASLDTPVEYFESVYNEYIERRNFMVEALNKMPGVVCPKPRGAFYAVVKLPVDDADTFAKWLLEEFEYNKQTVMVAPASGFYSTPGLGKNEVRIAYVLKIEELKGAMETLAKALEVYPGRV